MNDATAERSLTIGTAVTVVVVIMLLLALACFWYVCVIVARIGSALQAAFASPEFQEQMVVFAVLYAIAVGLLIAWNHFESLFDAPDAAMHAASSASSLFDCSVSSL